MTFGLFPSWSIAHDGDPEELWEEVPARTPEHAGNLALDLARGRASRDDTRDGARGYIAATCDIGETETSQDEFGPNRAPLL